MDTELFTHTGIPSEIYSLMGMGNMLYRESLDMGKTFSAEELERIKAWDGLIQDHIDRAYALVKEVYSKVFNLRYERE